MAGEETNSITANEIPSTYAVVKQLNKIIYPSNAFLSFPIWKTGELLRGIQFACESKTLLCSASFSKLIAVAKPQAIIDFRGGEEAEPSLLTDGLIKEKFSTPEPDEDFVDLADDYRMPWEENTPLRSRGS